MNALRLSLLLLVFSASPALAQVGISGRIEGVESTWTPTASAAFEDALALRATDPAAAAEALAALAEEHPGSARIRYELGQAYEAAYDAEPNATRAAEARDWALDAYRVAEAVADLDEEQALADEAAARTRELTQHTALSRQIRVKDELLKKGARGPAVVELQKILHLRADGVFGTATDAALRLWQRARGLSGDGVVGPKTLVELEEPLAKFRVLNSTYSAWSNGRRLGTLRVVRVDGRLVAVETARVYLRMRVKAAADGVSLKVSSGFRSYEKQAELYRRYREGHGNLAARPGYSNHQAGTALDLNTADLAVRNWLNANASDYGFVRTVSSEPWHWVLR